LSEHVIVAPTPVLKAKSLLDFDAGEGAGEGEASGGGVVPSAPEDPLVDERILGVEEV
jgi:hypothetical protein